MKIIQDFPLRFRVVLYDFCFWEGRLAYFAQVLSED